MSNKILLAALGVAVLLAIAWCIGFLWPDPNRRPVEMLGEIMEIYDEVRELEPSEAARMLVEECPTIDSAEVVLESPGMLIVRSGGREYLYGLSEPNYMSPDYDYDSGLLVWVCSIVPQGVDPDEVEHMIAPNEVGIRYQAAIPPVPGVFLQDNPLGPREPSQLFYDERARARFESVYPDYVDDLEAADYVVPVGPPRGR